MNQTENAWRKKMKKMGIDAINPMPVPPPRAYITKSVAPPGGGKIPAGKQLDDIFNAFFNPNPEEVVTYENDVWKINFPKIAEDLLDANVFKKNVITAVAIFANGHFPQNIQIDTDVTFNVENLYVEQAEYSYYPSVMLKPVISGKRGSVDKFMKSMRSWSGLELYWKGSFLKNKTNGLITSIRLNNIAYNIPNRYSGGQPIGYAEKILI
jgi:hypothetical protein